MLWYKAWLETRWRFVIGLVLLLCSAVAVVFAYPQVIALMPLVPAGEIDGELGRRIKEAAELMREYRGYVWAQWFRQNLPQAWILFAVILGTGGLLSQTGGGAALFTLSLPATRTRLLMIRAATALAELLLLAIVPSLLLWILSPSIGEAYSAGDALVHSLCLFVVGAVFFSLSFLLSTVFSDVWRPALLAFGVAAALSVVEEISRNGSVGVFRVMSAEAYFRSGELPWLGLLVSVVVSAALLIAATKNIARQDF
jgi:ABC-2 type transport system permease protein